MKSGGGAGMIDLVGARMSTRGFLRALSTKRWCSTGKRNAAVFPVPIRNDIHNHKEK